MAEHVSEHGDNYRSEQPLMPSLPSDSSRVQISSPITQGTTSSPPRKRKLTSTVWNDFAKKKIDEIDFAICNHCGTKLKAGSKNGTKHLHNHLERCVKRKNIDIRQQILTTNERTKDGKVQFGSFTFDQEASRRELACAIIMHEYPLSMVEHVQLRRFVSSLQPLFKMMSRNTIKSDILKIYDMKKQKMYKLMEKLKSRVAITTDMWTSSNQKRGYMVITSHFIDESRVLQSLILRFIYVPAPHKKEVLSDVLMDCLYDWNLDRKISTITVDNCSTNDGMLAILMEKLSVENSLLLDGKVLHMRCSAHILNLVVKDGMDVIEDAIEKVRDSIAFWTATPSRAEKFEDAARQLRIPISKKLALDCKTRWNSTFLMLQTALIYKDVFPRLKQREKLYTCAPSEEEWDLAKEICGRLKIFYTATELFSGTKYPTANCFFTKICEIRIVIYKWLICESEVVSTMASKMIEKFEKYWSVCHIIMAIAVVLDPQYKMKIVEYYFPMIYGSDSANEVQRVRDGCYDLLHEYQTKFKSNKGADHVSTSRVASSSCQSDVVSDLDEQDPLFNFDLFVTSTSSGVHIKSEMDHYLEESVLPRTPNFDVLSWWKTNGLKYPTLQLIARDILAIPVSTVASESAFSTSGRVVSEHRSRLHPNTLEALMCSQNWLWKDLEDNCSTADSSCIYTICDEDKDSD